jgi:hypothetical protein
VTSKRLLQKVAVPLTWVCLPTVLVAVAIPPALYFYALHLVGTPEPPPSPASWQEQHCVWRTVERTSDITVKPVTPWLAYGWLVAKEPLQSQPPGLGVASVAARQYVHDHHGRMPMFKWHLTTYAVAVWLTRHRSASELAGAVVANVKAGPRSRIAAECGLPPNPSLQRTPPG